MPPVEEGSGEAAGPQVFVDVSGKRDRRLRAAAWALSAVAAVYASGVGLSVVTAPPGSQVGDLPFTAFGSPAHGDDRADESRSHAADRGDRPRPATPAAAPAAARQPETGARKAVASKAADTLPVNTAGAVRTVSTQPRSAEPQVPTSRTPAGREPLPGPPPAETAPAPEAEPPAEKGPESGRREPEAPTGRDGSTADDPGRPAPEAPAEQEPGAPVTEPDTPQPSTPEQQPTQPPAEEQQEPPAGRDDSTPDEPPSSDPEPRPEPEPRPGIITGVGEVVDRLLTVGTRDRSAADEPAR